MFYPFLVQLEDEIRAEGAQEAHERWADSLSEVGYVAEFKIPAGMCRRFYIKQGIRPADMKVQSRMLCELSKWHKRWGHGENFAEKYVESWDEHRFMDAYDERLLQQPFNTREFLTAFDKLTGNLASRKGGLMWPDYLLSPNGVVLEDTHNFPLRRAMRKAWYGEMPKKGWWGSVSLMSYFPSGQQVYFLYQPEPHLWHKLIENAKPSYVKCRFYAYTHAKDMSVLQEPMLRPYLADMRSFARKAIKAKK